MSVRDPLGAEAAARALLKTYAEPVWAEVMEVGTGANLNKVRVKLPGEVAATADLPWAPVLGSVPTVGTQALTLKTSFGRWVVSGGTGGGGGGAVSSVFGRTGAVVAASGDYNASQISYAGGTGMSATDAEGALDELATEKLDATSYTAADVLAKLLTVDGSASNLDADKLDGNDSEFFLDRINEARSATMSGGGTMSWAVVANKFKWTTNIYISMPAPSGVASNRHIATHTTTPTSGITDDLGVERANADGITLNDWESLWAIQTRGTTAQVESYKVMAFNTATTDTYFANEEAHLICVRNGDNDCLYLRNGQPIAPGMSATGLDPYPQYATDTDLTAHVGAADPHTGYQKESEKDVANGYAGLDVNVRVPIARLASGTPDGTKFIRDDGTLAVPAGGSNYRTLVTLAADRTNSATTFADATGLSFSATSGVLYRFEALILYTVNAITVGTRFAISGPASPTRVAYTVTSPISALADGGGGAGAYDGTTVTAASGAHVDNAAMIFGFIQTSSTGTVIIRFAPETATLMTVRTGSTLEYW